MILSDKTINRILKSGKLIITPITNEQIQPASVDIRIGTTFSIVGFKGEITLELFNANRCAIEIKSGRRIGQLVFAQMDQSTENPYTGKYQGQQGATGSMVYLDVENNIFPKIV